MMTMGKFKKNLSVYGADPARWPAGARQGMTEFVRSSPAARQELDQAQHLDDALSAFAVPLPPANFSAQVMAALHRKSFNSSPASSSVVRADLFSARRFWLPAGAVAVAVVLFALGSFPLQVPSGGSDIDSFVAEMDRLASYEQGEQALSEELMAVLETAQAGPSADDAAIDAFIDELLGPESPPSDPTLTYPVDEVAPPPDMPEDIPADVWNYIMGEG